MILTIDIKTSEVKDRNLHFDADLIIGISPKSEQYHTLKFRFNKYNKVLEIISPFKNYEFITITYVPNLQELRNTKIDEILS